LLAFFKYKLRTGVYYTQHTTTVLQSKIKKKRQTCINKGVFININSERISKIYMGEKCLHDNRTNKQTTADTSHILNLYHKYKKG